MKAIIGNIVDPTVIKDGLRHIKLRWLGRNALRDVIHAKEPGTDTNPHPNTKMLILKTLDPKEDVAAMCVDDRNTREDLKEGEKAFYSYDADGNPLFIVTIRGNKTEIGTAPDGTPPSNFVTKFNEMQAAFDELKADQNKLVDAFNQHVHPTAAVGSPSPPTPVPSVIPATPSQADMSDAKSEEILIN
jgi:hypothetical protein